VNYIDKIKKRSFRKNRVFIGAVMMLLAVLFAPIVKSTPVHLEPGLICDF
jgi:hypothetical protein